LLLDGFDVKENLSMKTFALLCIVAIAALLIVRQNDARRREALIAAGVVTIGMTEAEVIRIKGARFETSTGGPHTIWVFPDLTAVTFAHGTVIESHQLQPPGSSQQSNSRSGDRWTQTADGRWVRDSSDTSATRSIGGRGGSQPSEGASYSRTGKDLRNQWGWETKGPLDK
jgi:hypothetical protein